MTENKDLRWFPPPPAKKMNKVRILPPNVFIVSVSPIKEKRSRNILEKLVFKPWEKGLLLL